MTNKKGDGMTPNPQVNAVYEIDNTDYKMTITIKDLLVNLNKYEQRDKLNELRDSLKSLGLDSKYNFNIEEDK